MTRGVMLFFLAFVLVSCGGSLSGDQRKKIRENMEARALRKISDAEITEAGFDYGRSLSKIIEAKGAVSPGSKFLDSLQKAYSVQIMFLEPTNPQMRGVEKQIIEAYTSGEEIKNVGDNLQRMGNDTLLYTKPILKERPDGSIAFEKALGIRILKKQIILSVKE